MLWYKHDTDASNDAKVKKLLIKHGAVGYAVYFHCLELIAGNISETNITFELEHDAEIIADNLRIKGTDANTSGREVVEQIMREIIDLGLFEEKNGHIFCFKLLKRLDLSMTSNKRLRSMITRSKRMLKNHDIVMTHHDKVMQEEKRREEIRRDEKSIEEKSAPAQRQPQQPKFQKPTVPQINEYIHDLSVSGSNVTFSANQFFDYYECKGWMVGKSPMKDWKAAVRMWVGKDKSKPNQQPALDKAARLKELNDRRGVI